MVRVLNLFSGTHSIGKICKEYGWEEVSLDKDLDALCILGSGYEAKNHIKEDILKWDYKVFPTGYFDLITASPVCLWWSALRNCWIGRKLKHMDRVFTRQDIQNDIDKFGKPMVDKVREIIDYFKPKYYWIENPKSGKMKTYITDLPYYDVDYCKYANWGYKKSTRFWTNIRNFTPKVCKRDCGNMVDNQHKVVLANGYVEINGKKVLCNTKAKRDKMRKKHKKDVSKNYGGGTNRYDRYRIPPTLIRELFNACNF